MNPKNSDQASDLRRLVLIDRAVNATALLVGESSPDCLRAIREDVEGIVNLLPAIEGYCKVSFNFGHNPLKVLRQEGIPCVFGDNPAPAHSAYYVRIVKEETEVTVTFEISR